MAIGQKITLAEPVESGGKVLFPATGDTGDLSKAQLALGAVVFPEGTFAVKDSKDGVTVTHKAGDQPWPAGTELYLYAPDAEAEPEAETDDAKPKKSKA